jgi:LuxR family maltose regulon positive regulatory protein
MSTRTSANRAAATLPFDVVESKIQAPVLRSGLVSRTSLVNRLRANAAAPLVAVAAPAGYGKTTLLAQWAEHDPRPFVWISVDERDRDAIVLLRHVGAALNAVSPLSPELFETLSAPAPSVWPSVLPRLAAAVSAAGRLVIVLDDVHLLRSVDSLEAVTVLIDHVGQGSALVLSGRATPNLPIAALRAAGRLVEIGVDDLALTPKEAQRLLRSASVRLPPAEVAALVCECEGWPAALYLAALTLRANEDRPYKPETASQLTAGAASLGAYLRSEYLTRLRPETVQFLRRTSVLEQMCGGLCDAVLGIEGSARTLERVERSNLFLVPLDRERVWYRYHRIFRDVLRRELAALEPQLVGILHARAADWYEAHGDPEAALEHARARGDTRREARILTTIALKTYHSGRAKTVERWLSRFDDDTLLKRYPSVALQGSWIHALSGRRATAERWLQLAETSLDTRAGGRATARQRAWLPAVRAALCHDGVYQMIADAESSLSVMGGDDPVRAFALMVLGAGYMLLGQVERADSIFADAAREAGRLGATDTQVVALGERSILAAARNDLSAAERLAHDAQHLVEIGSLDGYGTTAIAVAASARASLRHGDWHAARADLAKLRALMPAVRGGLLPWFAVQTQLEFARAHLALRETDEVRSLLAEVRELIREQPHIGVLVDEAETLERELEAVPRSSRTNPWLTQAELRLLPLLATHLSFREIGEQLFVSRNTIKTQAISVYRKLGVTSRSEAIASAAKLGLVDVGERSAALHPRGVMRQGVGAER